MENILNLPYAEQIDTQNALLASIASKMGGIDITSWDDLQRINRMGLGRKNFTVGDQILTNYNGVPTIVNIIAIDHPNLIPTDPRFTHTIAIQPENCLFNAQYSAPQAIYGRTEELPASTHIFTLGGVKYQVTTTLPMPANGVLVGAGWTDYVPSTITVYDADRRTVIESGLPVTIATGEDTLTPINDKYRCRYGSNNPVDSAIRQFLNCNDPEFIWKPQGLYDMPSTYAGTGGFLHQLDPELVAVLGEVENKVALPTIDGGGQATVKDKAFLLSRVEVGFESEGVTTGESVYEFYQNATNADRIKLLGSSPRSWWLRSPSVGYSNYPRGVGTTGELYYYDSYYAYGLSPVCVIV